MKTIKFLSLCVCVCVCVVDKRDESLAELLFVRMFQTEVPFKGTFNVIHHHVLSAELVCQGQPDGLQFIANTKVLYFGRILLFFEATCYCLSAACEKTIQPKQRMLQLARCSAAKDSIVFSHSFSFHIRVPTHV